MSDFKKRNIIIGALCGVLLLMIVGYAAFQSVLNIKGTANINSSWNVLITNIEESNRVGDATSVEEYPQYTELSATFQTNLVSPGDSITYDVTIENQGTIDAILEKITLPQLNNEAIIITTSGLEVGSELKSGATATLKVKVEYNPEVTTQPENTEANFEMTLDYVQKENKEYTPQTVLNMKGIEIPIVTEGYGLYNDPVEPGRYVFAGANPNNYITFNGEEAGWRIVSVEADGTIKIQKIYSVINMPFDSVGARTTGYCSVIGGSHGCNVWATADNYDNHSSLAGGIQGPVTKDSEIKTYLNTTYYDSIRINKDDIQTHNFYFGAVSVDSADLSSMVAEEKKYSAMSNVGLIQVSDYIKANSNKEQCRTLELFNNNASVCEATSYMQHNEEATYATYTINPQYNKTLPQSWNSTKEGVINYEGQVGWDWANLKYPLRPTIYLKSNINLDGQGTKEDPYTIS